MWTKFVFTLILVSAFLVGCNTENDNAVIDNNPNQNGEEFIDEQQDAVEDANDLQEGVNDSLENNSFENNINGNDINNGTNSEGGQGEDAYNNATRGTEGQDFNSENGTDNTESEVDVKNNNDANKKNRDTEEK